jgi:hypothetical protein
MTDRELMQMAYQATPHEVLIAEIMDCGVPKNEREHAAAREIQALRDRLAQPEPKPVGYMYVNKDGECEEFEYGPVPFFDPDITPVYAEPPKREWVGFTHEELAWLNEALNLGGRLAVIEAIEVKLKEKNT